MHAVEGQQGDEGVVASRAEPGLDPTDTIEQAGFTIQKLDTYYFPGDPKPFGYTFEGGALNS